MQMQVQVHRTTLMLWFLLLAMSKPNHLTHPSEVPGNLRAGKGCRSLWTLYRHNRPNSQSEGLLRVTFLVVCVPLTFAFARVRYLKVF